MSALFENLAKNVPFNVPENMKEDYLRRYSLITRGGKGLFLFAADHKIEHLAHDFIGEGLPAEILDPEYLFSVASKGKVGAFATQYGLLSWYGKKWNDINYIVKINSKTDLIESTMKNEPRSVSLISVEDVVDISRNKNLSIVGVSYTIYLGSKYEAEMLSEAGRIIQQAHKNGLLVFLWVYIRGENLRRVVPHDHVAGAAGVALCLGADFVKIHLPEEKNDEKIINLLKDGVVAAGETKLLVAGGSIENPQVFLHQVKRFVLEGNIFGMAVGRNIFQHPLKEAIDICWSLNEIIYGNKT